jgi:hypothetical protein
MRNTLISMAILAGLRNSEPGTEAATAPISETAKVIMFNTAEPVLMDDKAATELKAPIPKDAKEAPDVIVANRESAWCKLQARRFDDAKGWDVIEAAQNITAQLSIIPLDIARYVQGLYKNVPTVGKTKTGKKTNPQHDRRLEKYSNMCKMVGEELIRLHNIPENLPGSAGASYTARMQYFSRGQYWLRLTSDVRKALQFDLDLNKPMMGSTSGELHYQTYRDVLVGANAAKAAKAKAEAAAQAATPESEEEIADAPATPGTLEVNGKLPEKVRSQWNRLHGIVHGAQYETDPTEAKDSDSVINLGSRVLSHACSLYDHMLEGMVGNEDMDALAKWWHARIKGRKAGDIMVGKATRPADIDVIEAAKALGAEIQTHEANEAGDLADLEAAQLAATNEAPDTDGLPDVETGTDAPDASVNE